MIFNDQMGEGKDETITNHTMLKLQYITIQAFEKRIQYLNETRYKHSQKY